MSASIARDETLSGQSSGKSRSRHMEILDELESIARNWAASSSPLSSLPPHVGADGPSAWSLAQDADLAVFLHEFSLHVQRRAAEVARSAEDLEGKVRRTSAEVRTAGLEFSLLTNEKFVEQVVEEEECEESELRSLEEGRDGDGKEEDETMIEREEEAAIADGLKALSVFFDPATMSSNGGGGAAVTDSDHYFGLDGEDDSCHYYESHPGDVYNQRPLPFVAGSREFMESADAGLGEEQDDAGGPAAEAEEEYVLGGGASFR